MTEEKKITVTFAPGAFDQFEGTQEELDELIKEITRMAISGELEENSLPVEEVLEDNPEVFGLLSQHPKNRSLQ